jgi:hypothetical protein
MSGKLVQQDKIFHWTKEQLVTDLGISLGPNDQVWLKVIDVTGGLEVTIRQMRPQFPGRADLSDVSEVRKVSEGWVEWS